MDIKVFTMQGGPPKMSRCVTNQESSSAEVLLIFIGCNREKFKLTCLVKYTYLIVVLGVGTMLLKACLFIKTKRADFNLLSLNRG